MESQPEYFQFAFSEEPTTQDDLSGILLPFADSPLYFAKVTTVQTLTSGIDVKAVYDIGIDIKDIAHDYTPGDTIGILPENDHLEVEKIIKRLKLTDCADQSYNLSIVPNPLKKKNNIPPHISTKGTIRNLFLKRLDIRSIPKKAFLRTLAKYATVENDKERLELLGSPKAIVEYSNFISSDGKTLLGVLLAFSSCFPTISALLEHLPSLRPRIYSIITSPLSKNEEIRFAVSVLEQDAKGVCSGWLQQNLVTNEPNLKTCTIPFYFRKSNSFKLPEDTSTPIILVGPGTGVAPFIGFLRHRLLQKLNGSILADSWLFFGCRYSDRDFLYEHELKSYLDAKVLTKLITSFSRESNEKHYVQDNIVKHGKEMVDLLISNNAVLYVCGDAKLMRKDVKTAVIQIIVDHTNNSLEESEQLVNSWQKNNKYIEDIWI